MFSVFLFAMFVRINSSHWKCSLNIGKNWKLINSSLKRKMLMFCLFSLQFICSYATYHFFPRLNKNLNVLQLPCEYCEAIFENIQDCVAHHSEKHFRKYKYNRDGNNGSIKARLYLCEVCGKTYTQSSHLWQHLRFHKGK